MGSRIAVACLLLLCSMPLSADDLERDARELEAMLVAPCCWSQQVSVHQSEAASKIKEEVRASLRAGRTRQEILDAYVATYGVRILVEPPARGFTASLYVLPVLALVFSAGGVALIMRRFTRRCAPRSASPSRESPEPVSVENLEARLDEELQELD